MGGRLRKTANTRVRAALALAAFVVVGAFGVLVSARTAFAADGGASNPANATVIGGLYTLAGLCPSGGPVPIPCPPRGAADSLSAVDELLLKPLVESNLTLIALDLFTYLTDRLAYESAIALVSAGKGQTPLIFTDDPNSGYQRFGLDVAGETLGALSDVTQNVIGFKLDICSPQALSPTLRLNLALGIKQAYQPQRPKCDALQVVQNWQNFIATTSDQLDPDSARKAILQQFAQSLAPGQSEIGLAVDIAFDTREQYAIKTNITLQQQLINGGFKDVNDVITGQVKTPAALVLEKAKEDYVHAPEKKNEQLFNVIVAHPDWLIGALLQRASGVFFNTLLSQVQTSIYNGLINPPPPSSDVFNPNATSPGGREQAQKEFAGLLTANPQTISNYNALSEFVTCPSGSSVPRNVNNCVMDQSFASAVSRSGTDVPLTVQEAIQQGFLHGDWPLIPPTDEAKNQDSFCYSFGFCYGNLVKLRKFRILPIGWEIAAQLNTTTPPATLQQVIDGFDDCDTGGKWCHLIDPNWVLKYPDTQCKAFVNGEILATTASSARAGYCADAPSCVAQDANGNCIGGYGYCVREKNTWKFRGDSCPADFASCFAFTNTATNQQQAFLLNTVNYDDCSADNAGCRWYETKKFPENGSFTFLPASQLPYVVQAHDQVHDDRVYLNGKVKSCAQDDAGCSALLRANGLTLNMVRNPSFEDDADNDQKPDAWTIGSAVTYATSGGAFSGSDTLTVSAGANGTVTQSGVFLSKDSFYAVSLYGKNAATATVDVVLTNASTGAAADIRGTSTRAIGTVPGSCTIVGNNTVRLVTSAFGSSFDRQGCAFTANADLLATVKVSGSSALVIDAVQLERGELLTAFASNGYGSNQLATFAANLKVPPSYLNCRGLPTDPAECASFAPVCGAVDVGCNLYTPENGDASVPAVVSALDRCPNECVGYAAFKQEATKYELAKFPVNMIPTTATACSVNDAGCDAFTNIDALAAGGEGVEHYTDLRACVTSAGAGTSNATFYTWEGSDVQGFQLRTWTLLKDAASAAPCTSWHMGSANALVCDGSPAPGASCDEHADILTNLDCREFYDAAGVIHYREFSKTVTVSDRCHPYRKTNPGTQADCTASGGFFDTNSGECRYFGLPSESRSCPAAASGCRLYTGSSGNNVSTIFDATFENGAAATASFEADAGVTLTVSNDSVSAGGHSLRAANAASGRGVSTAFDEASGSGPLVGKLVAGKTFIVNFFAKGNGKIDIAFKDNGGAGTSHSIQAGLVLDTGWHSYSLGPIDSTGFGAGFNDRAVVAFIRSASGGASDFNLDNVQVRQVSASIALVKDSWHTPATCDTAPNGVSSPQYYLGCKAYTDKQGVTGSFFQFGHLCSEQVVGCSAFYDTKNSTSPYGKTFEARCTGAVGPCQVNGKTVCSVQPGKTFCLFDTDETFAASDSHLGPETQVVYNDSPVYLVDNGSDSCSAAAVGCMEVGLPKYDQDKTHVTGYTSTYLINKPDDYANILCAHEQLYCAEFKSASQGNFYFKDPLEQTCEFKDEVTVNGTKYRGWFQTGKKNPCSFTDSNNNKTWDPGEPASIAAGDQALIKKNGDPGYADLNGNGWYGTCETRYDQCTEFRDPSDTQNGRLPQGTSYFFVNNDKIKKAATGTVSCDGQVAQKLGCALFNDASKTGVTLSSSPTYVSSNHADKLFGEAAFSLVNPIDCSGTGQGGLITPPGANAQPVNMCAQRCQYSVGSARLNVANAATDAANGKQYFGSCLVDDDCSDQVAIDPASNAETNFKGSCVTLGQNQLGLWNKNDSNTVLQVQPDRQCAEWLACASSQVSWDDQQGKFKSICNAVQLCNAFSFSAEESQCTSFVPSDPIPLSNKLYQDRDVTWSGLEYSGFSIPGQLPADVLDQVNVAPQKWCVDDATGLPVGATPGADADDPAVVGAPTGTHGFGKPCSQPTDCDAGTSCRAAPQDNRLVYVAGSCSGTAQFGANCNVGSCKVTKAVCSTDANCDPGVPGDTCIVGFCQNVSATSCSTDANCSGSTPFCDRGSGRCVNMVEEQINSGSPFTRCSSSSSCSGTQGCVFLSSSMNGSCINGECLTRPDGKKLETPFDAADLSCRGYPETNSPFNSEVVKDWSKPFTSDFTSMPLPKTYRGGFQNVTACSPLFIDGKWTDGGDSCSCSYNKTTYGSGATVLFTPQAVTTESGEIPEKVCLSGDNVGQPCDDDGMCPASQCGKATKVESFFGYEGYCLEKDSSIQLFDNPSSQSRPCVTWYPVEQLTGATNLFAKFKEAGFSQDTFACAEVGTYYTLGTNIGTNPNIPGGSDSVACAEETALTGSKDFNSDNNCFKSVYCPSGFFAVMTPAGSISQDLCEDAGGLGDDCPFFCVPTGSKKIDSAAAGDGLGDGSSCTNNPVNVPGVTGDKVLSKNITASQSQIDDSGKNDVCSTHYTASDFGITNINFTAYLVDNQVFNTVRNYYKGCGLKGLTLSEVQDKIDQGDWMKRFGPFGGRDVKTSSSPFVGKNDTDLVAVFPGMIAQNFYRDLYLQATPYLGCKTAVQVGKGSGTGTLNQAWTDRAWIEKGTDRYDLRTPDGLVRDNANPITYKTISPIIPFGSLTRPPLTGSSAIPEHLATCNASKFALTIRNTAFPGSYNITLLQPTQSCASGQVASPGAEDGEDGRMYADTVFGSIGDLYTAPFSPFKNSACNTSAQCNSGLTCDLSLGQFGVGKCNAGPRAGQDCTDNVFCQALYCDKEEGFFPVPDDTVDCNATNLVQLGSGSCRTWVPFVQPREQVPGQTAQQLYRQRLGQAFAASMDFFTWDTAAHHYDKTQGNDRADLLHLDWNFTATGDAGVTSGAQLLGSDTNGAGPSAPPVETPKPPQVRGVGDCVGNACVEETVSSVSINRASGGVITGTSGVKHVALNFFAFADEEQLPIRKIQVDWGSGSFEGLAVNRWASFIVGSTDDSNYYKNFRGLKPDQITPYCRDTLGAAATKDLYANSCQTGYYTFVFDYECRSTKAAQLAAEGRTCVVDPGTGKLLNSPCTGGNVPNAIGKCVFQPRVFVQDNWGWCTGRCTDGTDDSTSNCYDRECNTSFPGTTASTDNNDPWVYYGGFVVVDPNTPHP